MRRSRFSHVVFTLGLAVSLSSTTASADEGQWMPSQISELDFELMRARGLELTAEQLWDPAGDERTGGLMRAAVNLSGCSASFISSEGLVVTNHHCAYSAIQANSSVENDYLADGFLAESKAAELRAKGKTVRVLRSVRDVTAEIEAARQAASSGSYAGDDAMYVAITEASRAASRELVETCEAKQPGLRCNVASFYNGSLFQIFEYVELRDVRLVYAPPSSIGEYGGEIDNWMWPRHTGDFSLLRAYVGPDGNPADYDEKNVPYTPGVHLKVSAEGVAPGDFVAILGYPGRTQRYQPAAEVARAVEQVLPFVVDFYGEWIAILERLGGADADTGIKVAALKKGLANRHKNARGMLAGIAQMALTDRRVEEDAALAQWVAEGDDGRARTYGDVLTQLTDFSARARETHERTVLVGSLRRGPGLLAIAIDLVRRASLSNVADAQRPAAFTDRNAAGLWRRQEGRLRDLSLDVDAEVFAMFAERFAALPEDQRVAKMNSVAPGADRAARVAAARAIFATSELADAEALKGMWDMSEKELRRRRDPIIQLAWALLPTIEEVERTSKARAGEADALFPRYFDMLRATREGAVYPDANSTLRFSHAAVMGYQKWDGSPQAPMTTLTQALDKHTGEDPFDLPQRVRDAAPGAPETYWSAPELGDLPLCFLSNGDTTGGNSGSPVIDGKGQLVGLNFDRVWENIAGDYGYNQGHSRNISVDIRFLLWMLDEVEAGGPLLEEMGLAALADAPARAALPPGTPEASETPPGCSCRATTPAGAGASSLAFALMGLLGLRRRRASPRSH